MYWLISQDNLRNAKYDFQNKRNDRNETILRLHLLDSVNIIRTHIVILF